ncbi:hypothetical protein K3152_04920 [Qipengyuania sp. 1NDH17]|uniref:Aspartate-semialdehyde dehydrogenase n=1 Tax=Qipengyuania polymorpha TaxID=2867234 RepID=A0ABS7J0J8_9SPHN|nr:hypothetical protein [Qipengyuania polymorpha]MBX7457584.1 hypothetical protein [Qipengyuania polymorpha]
MMKKTLLLVLPFTLAACGSGNETSQQTAPETEATSPVVQRLDDTVLVVDANGAGAVGQPVMRFGTAREEVDSAISQAYGSEPELGENGECGAGPMQFSTYGVLRLSYQGDKLVGWTLGQGDAVATSDGVQPGMTPMTLLREKRDVRDITSSLEGEFEYTTADYGTIGGFAENGQIVSLHAGMNCFFR